MNLRSDARKIFRAALKAADPSAAVIEALAGRDRELKRAKRIFVVGAGKASGTMARAAERFLGKRITSGCVLVKDGDLTKTRRIALMPAGHPVPDERGVSGAREICRICGEAEQGDLVLCLISGGASALMPLPAEPVTLEEKQATTKLLLDSGADIREMNSVRKHISAIKGGQLARLAAPAKVISLILSDVVGDDLDVIGSGPTAPDLSTFAAALNVLAKYRVRDRVPRSVLEMLESSGEETPKPGDRIFDRVENVIVGSNQKSLEAAAKLAKSLGYRTIILSSTMEGETKDAGRLHAAIARQIRMYGQPLRSPACVISGGETTVTIRGKGKGGRNQEFVLAAAIDLAGLREVLILSAGTDGTDGPTNADGAIADGRTIARSSRNAHRALEENDSYPFFEDLDDLIITGATGTNVMDFHLILAG